MARAKLGECAVQQCRADVHRKGASTLDAPSPETSWMRANVLPVVLSHLPDEASRAALKSEIQQIGYLRALQRHASIPAVEQFMSAVDPSTFTGKTKLRLDWLLAAGRKSDWRSIFLERQTACAHHFPQQPSASAAHSTAIALPTIGPKGIPDTLPTSRVKAQAVCPTYEASQPLSKSVSVQANMTAAVMV